MRKATHRIPTQMCDAVIVTLPEERILPLPHAPYLQGVELVKAYWNYILIPRSDGIVIHSG